MLGHKQITCLLYTSLVQFVGEENGIEIVVHRLAVGREHVLDLLVLPHAMLLGFFDIQDLTAQRHDRLEVPVAALLGDVYKRQM